MKTDILYSFQWRGMANRLITAQGATDCKISQRRVDILCEEGRAEVAIVMENRNDSLKLEDKRRAKNITDCGGNPHG